MTSHLNFLIVIIITIPLAASPQNIPPKQTLSKAESPEISSLNSDVVRLRDSSKFWTRWYLGLVFAAVVLTFGTFVSQYLSTKRSQELAVAEALLGAEKDRESASKIAELNKSAAENNRLAASANERAGKAEVQLAEANVRLKEAEAQVAAANAASKDAVSKVAAADARSAEASVKAEGFRLEIAQANESAEQAKAQVAGATAEAAKANLELAKLKTPRTLSKEQQDRIRDKVRRFGGSTFDLYVSVDSDATQLMDSIDGILRSAEWKFIKPGGTGAGILYGGKAGITVTSGVLIEISSDHLKDFELATIALRDALNAEGIPVLASAQLDETKNSDAIHVIVGSKPLR